MSTLTFPLTGITFEIAKFADGGHGNETQTIDGTVLPYWQALFVASMKEAMAAVVLAGAALQATSTTSATIGTGSKSLAIQADKGFSAGNFVIAKDADAAANWMLGTVDSYDSATGSLAFTVASGDFGGSGSVSNWEVSLSGPAGPAGSVTLSGNATGDIDMAGNNFTTDGVLANQIGEMTQSPATAMTGTENINPGIEQGKIFTMGAGTLIFNFQDSTIDTDASYAFAFFAVQDGTGARVPAFQGPTTVTKKDEPDWSSQAANTLTYVSGLYSSRLDEVFITFIPNFRGI